MALHPEKLKALKEKLANNLTTAPLYNTALFTKHLESAYLSMYDRYQKRLNPEHIYVGQKEIMPAIKPPIEPTPKQNKMIQEAVALIDYSYAEID